MKITKKWSFTVIMLVTILCMVFIGGCAGSKSEVKGKIYETEKFSVLVPDEWETTDMEPGVLIKPGDEENHFMMIQVNGTNVTEAEVEAEVKALIEIKPAFAPITEVTMLGVKFFKISGTAENGSEQTAYAGVRNGEKVAIMIVGKDNQKDKILAAMLESIKFK